MSYGGSADMAMQQQMSFAIISSLTKSCMRDCSIDFRTDQFSAGEETCLNNCASRYSQGSILINQVNQELASSQGGAGSFQ